MKKPELYNHEAIEKKWQKEWQTKKVYKTESNSKKKKMYVLDMFPYPSGAGLHVGHPRGYIGSDVFARMKRMQGFNVLHPMGYDAFGLPAEQFAIAHKIHPRKAVEKNVATFERQLGIIGLSYDWTRKVNTTDPEYYKWTQWIFLKIFDSWYDNTKQKARPIADLISIFEKKGNLSVDAACDAATKPFTAQEWKAFSSTEKERVLMQYRLTYEGWSEVNWSPSMGTVLANDEILDTPEGPVAERDGKPVEKKLMRQWFMRITAYAERLIQDLDGLDWSDAVKEIQRNWIGKSEGSLIPFTLTTDRPAPKRILVGTRNQAKFKMLKECFPKNTGIEFVSLNDIPHVDDSALVEGQDFELNAKMKSEFYFKKTGIPTISMDNVFWVEKWPKDNHVVIHMRKEAGNGNDKTSDEDVIAFFQKWLKKVGDSNAHFIYAVAFTDERGTRVTSSKQRDYVFKAKPLKGAFYPGHPTECLLFDKETGVCKGKQKNEERYGNFMRTLRDDVLPWILLSERVNVFTTRADTLFGVTYVVLAPESELVQKLQSHIENWSAVEAYIADVRKKTQEERTSADKEKTGIELKGIFAVHPATGEHVPVWIGDYVLANYGTGAVMAVPAHDERDLLFAKKYKLPIKVVIAIDDEENRKRIDSNERDHYIEILNHLVSSGDNFGTNRFFDDGFLIDSAQFSGLTSAEARVKITEAVGGKLVTKYKMRDAVFARQRYWGEPIPLIHKDGVAVPLKEKNLPLKLPNVTSYEPTGTGESPLAGVKAWVKAGYETNTMPGWAGSSWYFLRYIDPSNKKAFASDKELKYWFGAKDGGVDMYVGGVEHATGHLLYSRFWHKFLHDLGYVPSKEPFRALRNQGMIGGADGRKMSKRWGNVVNPDDVVKTYGADSLRVFEMFLGPFDSHLPWSTDGIIGSRRFIEKVWRLQFKISETGKTSEEAEKVLHKTIKKVTEDIAAFNFNTAVSAMMICVNEMEKAEVVTVKDFKTFLQILAPFASHITEDIWNRLGEKKSIHVSGWPTFDPKKLVSDTVKIVVQVNGKNRAELMISKEMSEEDVKALALKDKAIVSWVENKEVRRVIYVPGRLVNIVV